MAKALTTVAIDATQEVAQGAILEGNTQDVSSYYGAILQVWYALTNATAHTGTRIIVEYSTDSSGDEDWAELAQFVVGVGTTNLETITNNPATAGATVITCASTTGYTVGIWIFLEDGATFANSEWGRVVAVAANTSVTLKDGITRQHANTSVLNSVAGPAVPVMIPEFCQRIRVIYDNSYDADGATVAIKAQLTGITAY